MEEARFAVEGQSLPDPANQQPKLNHMRCHGSGEPGAALLYTSGVREAHLAQALFFDFPLGSLEHVKAAKDKGKN